jgi:ribosomal protein S18 acetylase RimI-like enzyme
MYAATEGFTAEAALKAVAEAIKHLATEKLQVRGCPGKEAAKSSLVVRIAQTRDADLIADWVSERELRLLGASLSHQTTGPQQRKEIVINWIQSALTAYVLEANRSPVGFLALERNVDGPDLESVAPGTNDPMRVEFGRLVISPSYRRRGYGSSLLLHLYKAYLEYRENEQTIPCHVLMRTYRENKTCIDFLRRLPVKRTEVQKLDDCYWYVFADIYQYQDKDLGRFIATRREEAELTQQRLAFLACTDQSTLAMVESGQRRLRLDDANRILSVLCNEHVDELQFAARLLGLPFNELNWSYLDTLAGELEVVNQSLWVFSDQLAEEIIEKAINKSVEAVANGFDRFYFVPYEFSEATIAGITKRLLKGLRKADVNLSSSELNKRIRFYKVPPALCKLRIAVHDRRDGNARKVSVGTGRVGRRVAIAQRDDPLTVELISEFLSQMLNADDPVDGVLCHFKRVPLQWD